MYEHKSEKLLPFDKFLRRLGVSSAIAFAIVGVGMLIGTLGYKFIAHLEWIDAVLNASMILTGMGPVAPMTDTASKLFATFYALFSGVIFLSGVGIMLSPLFHRILHRFHLEGSDVD
jgi:hypothetical protein